MGARRREADVAKTTKKRRKQNVPKVCNEGLSRDMKAGDPKRAMKNYWVCRREHGEKKKPTA
jgi:hypothetical protein